MGNEAVFAVLSALNEGVGDPTEIADVFRALPGVAVGSVAGLVDAGCVKAEDPMECLLADMQPKSVNSQAPILEDLERLQQQQQQERFSAQFIQPPEGILADTASTADSVEMSTSQRSSPWAYMDRHGRPQ